MKKFLFIIILIVIGMSGVIYAESTAKTPIAVTDNSSDFLGRVLAYKFKEKIRQSPNLQLTDENSLFHIKIIIHTIESPLIRTANVCDPTLLTVYSVIWTISPDGKILLHYDNEFGYCGKDRVDDLIDNFIARTDKISEELNKSSDASSYFNY